MAGFVSFCAEDMPRDPLGTTCQWIVPCWGRAAAIGSHPSTDALMRAGLGRPDLERGQEFEARPPRGGRSSRHRRMGLRPPRASSLRGSNSRTLGTPAAEAVCAVAGSLFARAPRRPSVGTRAAPSWSPHNSTPRASLLTVRLVVGIVSGAGYPPLCSSTRCFGSWEVPALASDLYMPGGVSPRLTLLLEAAGLTRLLPGMGLGDDVENAVHTRDRSTHSSGSSQCSERGYRGVGRSV